MAAKPLISLTSKDFLTGINLLGEHGFQGGIFAVADGVNPLFEAGKAQSTLNGLLMPGAAGTVVGGTPNGNFTASTVIASNSPKAYFGTSTGHVFSWAIDSGDTPPTGANLADAHTAAATITGLSPYQPAGGTAKLYYWQLNNIGDYDLSSTWDDTGTFTGGTDSSISAQYLRPVYRYFDQILYGNGFGKIGSLQDDLASGVENQVDVLSIPPLSICSAIADDGVYAVLGITNNVSCDPGVFADTRILYWDGASTNWLREYTIADPFILSIKKTPTGVYAFGITGIWQLSFANGPKKIVSHSPGIYTTTGFSTLLYGGAATSFFSDALLWGGGAGSNSVIKSMGLLDSAAPKGGAYMHPFLTTAGKNITLLDGQILKGWIIVGDTTPQLVAYPFSTTNAPQTSVSAQTIYFPLPQRMQITHIDVVFGDALASGDAFNIQTQVGTDASAATFDSASYTTDGAVYRKVMTPKGVKTPIADSQISFIFNWTGGAVKIKRVDIYAEPTPAY